ncbi:MAG: VOC family protein [Candidatus Aenigmatarchaeota archaeon]|nr:MAG: VOC family protein [Candidatus Aenigmarchaeota archaeon]
MSECKITGLGIHLKVGDFDRSRKFYESLGFRPIFAYGDEKFRSTLPKGLASAPERYRGMTFEVPGGAKLEIAEGHIAITNSSVFKEQVKTPKISAMISVESLVPLLKNANVNIKVPIRHYYWGTIEAAFRDPDGFVLVFIAPFSEEELKRVRDVRAVETVKSGK